MVLDISFDFRMFVPVVVLSTLLILFLRKGYKYSDMRFLFAALVAMIIGAFLGFIEPRDSELREAFIFFEHAVGATVTAWLLAMDTYLVYTNRGRER